MDEDLENVLMDLAKWRQEIQVCLDQSGNKYENDKQLVLERLNDRLDNVLDYFASDGAEFTHATVIADESL